MFSIGEFSKLAKTTIKTLRFYDEIGLFKPSFVQDNGYRYYSIDDLNTLNKILELRSIDLSINEIKNVLDGQDLKPILIQRSRFIEEEIQKKQGDLSLINTIIYHIEKGDFMNNYQAKVISIPEIKVYFRHGVIKNMSELTNFVLESGAECGENNPNLKCEGYCYVIYEAPYYQEENVELEYVEQVAQFGKESKNIKFKTVPQTKAISVTHKGSYSKLAEAYAFALNYVKERGYSISDKIREVYVHGCWDMESEDDYETEIQIPIK